MTTSSPQEDRVDWAGMPSELLTCVSQLLDVPTRICFRAVCRWWREAADDVAKQDGPAAVTTMPPPWVVIPDDIGCSKSFTLLSVPTRQSFRWTPPGGGLGLRCVGSNGGWLAAAYVAPDQTVRITLVNPLTGARVEAPPYGRVSLTSDDPEHQKAHVEFVLSAAVQKVAFSPNPTAQDFAVAVVGVSRLEARAGSPGSGSRAAAAGRFGVTFARAGGWCAFAELDRSSSRLDVAYRDGKFYYMSNMTVCCGKVCVVDMAAPDPEPVQLATLPPDGRRRRRYHLGFSGDGGALHVVSSSDQDAAHRSPRLDVLTQWHDDPSGGLPDGVPPWTQTRLPGQAFLVGDFNQTMCVADGAWLRPDSVYFAGVPLCSELAEYSYSSCVGVWREREIARRDGVGVWRFDLIRGNFERPDSIRKIRLRPPLEFWQPAWSRHKDELLEDETWNRLDWSKAIWFMPSMR
ncbi:hypothetical protein EJB05_31869, partial [Eragrostis curvula]